MIWASFYWPKNKKKIDFINLKNLAWINDIFWDFILKQIFNKQNTHTISQRNLLHKAIAIAK